VSGPIAFATTTGIPRVDRFLDGWIQHVGGLVADHQPIRLAGDRGLDEPLLLLEVVLGGLLVGDVHAKVLARLPGAVLDHVVERIARNPDHGELDVERVSVRRRLTRFVVVIPASSDGREADTDQDDQPCGAAKLEGISHQWRFLVGRGCPVGPGRRPSNQRTSGRTSPCCASRPVSNRETA
jgi:hypothetical protein